MTRADETSAEETFDKRINKGVPHGSKESKNYIRNSNVTSSSYTIATSDIFIISYLAPTGSQEGR
jgi:hypothetical protein